MNKCTGIMGRIFGHNFKPVITKVESREEDVRHGTLMIKTPVFSEVYNGCVCRRCGSVVERIK